MSVAGYTAEDEGENRRKDAAENIKPVVCLMRNNFHDLLKCLVLYTSAVQHGADGVHDYFQVYSKGYVLKVDKIILQPLYHLVDIARVAVFHHSERGYARTYLMNERIIRCTFNDLLYVVIAFRTRPDD